MINSNTREAKPDFDITIPETGNAQEQSVQQSEPWQQILFEAQGGVWTITRGLQRHGKRYRQGV
ncbi:MAG: hypothetical protein WCX61_00470 [Candidatus Peribacteraceae bacterium]|jgi:hypothetical protein